MRYPFLASLFFLPALAVPSHAANKPAAPQTSPAVHVWANDDLGALRSRALISTFEPYTQAISFQPPPVLPPVPAAEPLENYAHTSDPVWYAGQTEKLRDALDQKETELQNFRNAIDQAANRDQTTGGIDMAHPNIGVTPASGEAILESQVRQIQSQLDDLEDLARRNDVPPGVLRG